MTTAGSQASNDDKDSQQGEHPITPRWSIIVPVAIVAAVVLLVGLPLGALGIVHYSGCCFSDGPEDVVTFWAALTAGFLALFGGLITAVFIITAFRIDTTAKMEARLQADRALDTYLKRYKKKAFDQIEGFVGEVDRCRSEAKKNIEGHEKAIEQRRDRANEAINGLQQEVQQRWDAASKTIEETQKKVAEEADTASQSFTTLQNDVANRASAARQSITDVREGVEGHRDEAVRTINGAVESVEAAARDARARIEQAERRPPTEGDEGGPNA